ncbi:MAG TPA: hypothetical protein PK746_04025, partial [Spirochaetales bacterium]|nr:hypothetical protein [Spirochaetales bacterium]
RKRSRFFIAIFTVYPRYTPVPLEPFNTNRQFGSVLVRCGFCVVPCSDAGLDFFGAQGDFN